MRWFKHITTLSSDEVMSSYIDTFGAEGYGVWWLMIEAIARLMDDSDRCGARYSVRKWAQICAVSTRKFRSIAQWLKEHNQISVVEHKQGWYIECPLMLRYKDEYTRKKKSLSGRKSGRKSKSDTEVKTMLSAGKQNEDIKESPISMYSSMFKAHFGNAPEISQNDVQALSYVMGMCQYDIERFRKLLDVFFSGNGHRYSVTAMKDMVDELMQKTSHGGT